MEILQHPNPNRAQPTPSRSPWFALVTGGARSGKSTFAEGLVRAAPTPVAYVATATVQDDEMRARVEEHRRRRPSDWRTLEIPLGLAAELRRLTPTPGVVLIEDVGLLVSNLLFQVSGGAKPGSETAERLAVAVGEELAELDGARRAGGWQLVMVTNEVGLGLVPGTSVGRVFRDALGRANQALAARADAVYLLVAGLPLTLKQGPMPAERNV